MPKTAPAMGPDHPDFNRLSAVRDAVYSCVSPSTLGRTLAERTLQAAEIVLDPVRTARTKISELEKVEKTFIGLMIEHQIRDMLGVPKGLRRDLRLGGEDVDLKSSVVGRSSWMIPPESFRDEELCMLVGVNDVAREVSMGLFVARRDYLGRGEGNRDKKLSITSEGTRHVLWLVRDEPWPADRWMGLNMARFRELRGVAGGELRATTFFLENIERPTHRSVVHALLFDHYDYMKRLRRNGGARDRLDAEGIDLVWGRRAARLKQERRDLPVLGPDDFIAVRR